MQNKSLAALIHRIGKTPRLDRLRGNQANWLKSMKIVAHSSPSLVFHLDHFI